MAETRVHSFLDFEKPIAELEGKIEELRHLSDDGEISIVDEVERLQSRVNKQLTQTYAKLTPGKKYRSRGIPTGRIAWITSMSWSPISPRWQVTEPMRRTTR